MWYALAAAVLLIAFIVWKLGEPARRRQAAIRQARAQAEALVKSRPNDPDAKVRLAGVLVDLAGDPEAAVLLLDAVVKENPTHWAKGLPPSRFQLAHAHVSAGRLDRGIEHFEVFLSSLADFDTHGDKEQKWLLETHKVDAEQRIRLLKKGDTHIHRPEQWGDAS